MKKLRTVCFPFLAGALYVWFLILDLTHLGDSTLVKYAAILLCLAVSLTGLDSRDGVLVTLALAFTVGADTFLLLRNDHYVLGVGLFCAAQLLYCVRLGLIRGRAWVPGLVVRPIPLVAVLLLGATPLMAVTAFYFTNLVVNTVEAFALRRKDAHGRLFAVGLALFVGCDLCVGGWNLMLFPAFTRVGMWLFYLPSQVCIVLSAPMKGVFHETEAV